MEKKRCFLGFLASLAIVFFTTNLFAAGYSCAAKRYTSCNLNYYMSGGEAAGNSCNSCPSNSTSLGGTTSSCTCKTGYTVGGTQSGESTTTTTACSVVTYNITYNLNSGSGCSNTTYNVNSSTITLCTPSRSGYTFGGWYDNSSFTGSAVSSVTAGSTGNKTFYAKWNAITYTLNYTCGTSATGGSTPASQNPTYGSSYKIAAATCQRDGYTYTKWTDGTTQYTAGSSYTWQSTSDKTLSPVWENAVYAISLDSNTPSGGSSVIDSTSAIYQKYATGWYSNSAATTSITKLSKIPYTQSGLYIFQGYYTAKTSGTQIIDANGNIKVSNSYFKANTTLYAQWGSCVCGAGTGVDSGCTITRNSTHTGCTYTASCLSGYGEPACSGQNSLVGSCQCSLQTSTITYNKNGGSGSCLGKLYATPTETCIYGSDVTLPTWDTCPLTKTGYVFRGWGLTANDLFQDLGASTTCPTTQTTYYAQWCQPTRGNLKVIFGSVAPESIEYSVDETTNTPKAHATCPAGYSKSGGTNRETEFDVSGTAGNCTVYVPNCRPMSYNVSLYADGGTFPNGETTSGLGTVAYGAELPASLSSTYIPTRVGYIFKGFYDSQQKWNIINPTQYYDANGELIGEKTLPTPADLTLYAHWDECAGGTYYDNSTGTPQCIACPSLSGWNIQSDSPRTGIESCYAWRLLVGHTTTNLEPTDWCYSMNLRRNYDKTIQTYGDITSDSTMRAYEGAYIDKSDPTDWQCRKCGAGSFTSSASKIISSDKTLETGGSLVGNPNIEIGGDFSGEIAGSSVIRGSTGATECTPCQNGTTTPNDKFGKTKDICDTNCHNTGNVSAWVQATWNKDTNTVTNVCTISECSAGYTLSNGLCVPKCNAVELDYLTNGGGGGDSHVVRYKLTGNKTWYGDSNCASTYVTPLQLPDKKGYTFAGYYFTDPKSGDLIQYFDASGQPTTAGNDAVINGNITLYAQFTPNTYNVTYSCGEGSGTPPPSTPATFDDRYTLAEAPDTQGESGAWNRCSYPNHAFNGWLAEGESSPIYTEYQDITWKYAHDTTFVAQWVESKCQKGYFHNGFTCEQCPTGYTSDAGATDTTQCYRNCDYDCNKTNICSDATTLALGLASCSYTNETLQGKSYYGNGTCTVTSDQICYATYTCKPGYESAVTGNALLVIDNQLRPNTYCEPGTYSISFERNGGTGGPDKIYEKYTVGYSLGADDFAESQLITQITAPQKTNYKFKGYYTGQNGQGTKIIDENGNFVTEPRSVLLGAYFTENVTLYADWELSMYTCVAGKGAGSQNDNTAACAPGAYCPGGLVPADKIHDSTEGCQRTCPADAQNGTVSSAAGASSIGQCYTTRTGALGGEGHGTGEQICNYSTTSTIYDDGCNTTIIACDAGYYRPLLSSTVCSPVGYGNFSVSGNLDLTKCSTLNGAEGKTVTTETQTSGAATDCYTVCNPLTIDKGVLNPANATPHYNGTAMPACDYNTTPVCDSGYEPSGTTCVPSVYTITLSDNGGNGGSGKIYLKYATGWFSNAAATTALTAVQKPTKADSDSFGGYEYNGVTIIDADGVPLTTADALTFTTQNQTITAVWDTRTPITCTAGTYYSYAQSKCVQCTHGNYCEGVSTFVGVSEDKGIKSCGSLNGTVIQATTDGKKGTLSSAAGSKAATDCYATLVAYTSDTQLATGSQTCYYLNGAYTDRCYDRKVLACAGGYYLANTSDIDCTAAGSGYYSPADATVRTACPGKTSNSDVTTDTETSDNVQACFLGNIWLNPGAAGGATHGGVRRSCHHKATIDNANSTAGYTENCPVTEVVTCDAGYWLANSADTDCVPVGEGYYSPAQSYFTSEPEKPTIEYKSNQTISSLLRSKCPTNSATGTQTAATAEWCCVTTKDVLSSKDEKIGTATWNGNAYNVANKCMYSVQCDDGYKATGLTNGLTATPKCVWADPNACPEDSYCPDGAEEPIECPLDENGTRGTTDDTNAKTITDCHIAYDPYKAFRNGTGTATCYYSNDSKSYTACRNVTAKSCIDGFYYSTAGAATCVAVPSGQYSPAPDIAAKTCPAGGNGSRVIGTDNTGRGAKNWDECYKNCELTVAHSETVSPIESTVYGISAEQYKECKFNVTCQRGYTETNNGTSNPTCNANTYTVTLDKNGGTGTTPDSIQCTFDSGACTLPDASGLQRAGYSAVGKWCTESNGGGTCYNAGMTVTSNISASGTNVTLYAIWTPNVYKVTLNHADANLTAQPTEAYLKYATGWFTTSDAIIPLSKLDVLPQKSSYEFAGYKSANGINIISAGGQFLTNIDALTFTTTDTTVNVVWSAGNTTCASGYYYAGISTLCNLCPAGSYCPGGSFPTDAGEAGKNVCRDGGTSVASTSAKPVSMETQCFKTNLPTYVAAHGQGTQTCYFDEGTLTYSANCKDKNITSCDAGYWQSNKTATQENPDCDEVGNGYYSGDADVSRVACPNGGTTSITTAANIQLCFKINLEYAATYGSGTQRCFYSNGEGDNAVYNRGCDNQTISQCRGGYWLDTSITSTDCSPVGQNYYSEDKETSRHACEDGGMTAGDTTSDPHLCYKGDEVYTAKHGGGYRTCYYTSGTGSHALYETSCETPTLTHCDAGYYANITKNANDCIEVGYGFFSPAPDLERGQCNVGETTATATSRDASACFTCPAGQICDPNNEDKPVTCSDLTGGKYTLSDAGMTDAKQCYRECSKSAHAATMTGRDYYNGTNTCEVAACMAGYHLQNGQCVTCPAGMFCEGTTGDDTPKSCADLGDGSWKYSDAAATGQKSCYRKCEAYPIEGGMAVPVSDRAYYDSECEFKGRDDEGNPCDIETGACVVKSCKNSHKMENGKCVPCNVENALTYKTEGNCQVATCRAGFHPYGQSCEGDTVSCTAPNAVRAEMQWNAKTNAFGICTIKECEAGFHISSNACVADVQACTVENGRGEKEWNHKTNTWGDCIATYCDPGYTNDPSESDNPTKQCGHCANKFGVGGEIAASTYSRGCTISACMYQGEMYNLENNECVPICSVEGYSDATGTMKWNPRTKKCERTCFDGYTMW